MRRIMALPAGRKVSLTVRQNGTERQVELVVEEMPTLSVYAPRYVCEQLGFIVRQKVALDRHLDKSPTAGTPGLAVIAVAPRSPAAEAGLKVGDLVTAVNGEPVRSADVIKQVVTGRLAGDQPEPVILMVRRGDSQPLTITINPSVGD